jgi:PAS domain S-box-containing protein
MMVVYFVRDWSYVQQVILDASIMTVIIFPILYFLSFRPLLLHIHQRSQAEKELRQSEVKFRTFVDWTYDWEDWFDPQGKIVYTSPSCERITGYTPEELFKNPDLLTSIVHPDDRQFYEEHQAIIHDAKAAPTTVEYRIASRDGSEHWIEHICRPVYGRDERYLGRRVSNRDITERKQAEKKIIDQNKKEIILTETIQSIQTDIARDLHDTLGQNISFLRMNLEHLSDAEFSNQTYMQTQIRHMTKTADESYELIRTMLANLQSGY